MVKNIAKSYGVQHLFQDVSFFVGPREKVALVGPNGCGKTTLIRIIGGQEKPDSGEVILPGKNFNLGILEQFANFSEGNDVFNEACESFRTIRNIERRLRELETGMENAQSGELERLGGEYAKALEKYDRAGGYGYESEVRRTLLGIGFPEVDWTKPVEVLSGGERTRLALCKLLLGKPDMLILDEPTNHLDLPALEWFEEFIAAYSGGCLIVSHDRFFIDRIADRILEITPYGVDSYKGGYQAFLDAKRLRLEQQWAAYEKQQENIGKMERFVARWSADKIRASQAKDRQKKLDRLEMLDKPREIIPKPVVRLKNVVRSFETVLRVSDLYKHFDSREIFGGINLEVNRGERLAIVGRNGEGKTTFLRCLVGESELDSGEVHFGGKVEWAYFSQTHSELDYSHTVLDEFQRLRPGRTEQDARARLGSFLFSEDDVEKIVGDISGGERSKLALAVLIDEEPNVLLLDEPTNHLDIPSCEALEAALEQFPGTIIFVSHDRRFIDRLADKVLEFEDGKTELFHGNYTYYHEKKLQRLRDIKEAELKAKEAQRESRAEKARAEKRAEPPAKKQISEFDEAIERITTLESEINSLQQQLLNPAVYEDYRRAGEINRRIKLLSEKLKREEESLGNVL